MDETPRTPVSFKVLLSGLTLAFIGVLGGCVFLLNKSAPENQPVVEKAVAGCSQKTGSELQSCCEAELVAKGAGKIQCIGEWQFKDNQCAFVCANQ